MTTEDLVYGFLPIVTKARQEDGTLRVTGKVAGTELDGDAQRMSDKWLAEALPTWFTTGANVREQHGTIAAGIGKVLSQDGSNWSLDSLIVDPGTIAKVEHEVLKGYSVGIKGCQIVKTASAPKGEIVGGRIVEVSLVDRPCNETCKLDLVKSADKDEAQFVFETLDVEKAGATDTNARADGSAAVTPNADDSGHEKFGTAYDNISTEEELQAALAALNPSSEDYLTQLAALKLRASMINLDHLITLHVGAGDPNAKTEDPDETKAASGGMPPLEPGGEPRYPITDAKSLKNAMQALGRAKAGDKAAVKAHIIARAKALGLSNLLTNTYKTKADMPMPANSDMSGSGVGPDNADTPGPTPTGEDELPAIQAACDAICKLLESEVAELGDNWDELYDIETLLCALRALREFWWSETQQGEVASPDSVSQEADEMVQLSQVADLVKSASADDASDADKALLAELRTALGADLVTKSEHETITANAIAEATKSLVERIEKMEASAAPGGPVKSRPAADVTKASLRETAFAEAEKYERFATQVNDPDARAGYRAKAAEARLRADDLVTK
jgi:hypothetical protein